MAVSTENRTADADAGFQWMNGKLTPNAAYNGALRVRRENGWLYSRQVKGRRITVHGRLRYISDKGGIGIIDDNLWNRVVRCSLGPEVQVTLAEPDQLLGRRVGQLATVSGEVSDIYVGRGILHLNDGRLEAT